MHGKYKGSPLAKQVDFILKGAKQLIIFTDLDGTLLDHDTYDYTPTLPALQRIRQYQIPLILTSSKTFIEINHWAQELALAYPFIFENGAGIAFPESFPNVPQTAYFSDGYFIRIPGPDYQAIRQLLNQLKKVYHFRGFGDMTTEEIARLTRLPTAEAHAARQRLASEPIVWEDTPEKLQAFQQQLHVHHLQLLKGGRFYHVLGKAVDKGKAVQFIVQTYEQLEGFRRVSIGIGDSPNDLPMLTAVDIPVVVQRADGSYMSPLPPHTIRAAGKGPVGWNAALLTILEQWQMHSSHQPTGGS